MLFPYLPLPQATIILQMLTSQIFHTLRDQQLTERWLGTGYALCLSHDRQFLQQIRFLPAAKAE
jgi:hypothetical protein